MPTGYTAAVSDGKVTTLRQFAMDCARAMGACIMLRDEPGGGDRIPEKFEPSDYHAKALAAAHAELDRLRAMSDDEASQEASAEHVKKDADEARYAANRSETRDRYERMAALVRAWEPPTKDHVGLKSFMLRQLLESVEFDCAEYPRPQVVRLSGRQWRELKIERAEKDIAYHAKEHEAEVRRATERTEWVRALRASLQEPQ